MPVINFNVHIDVFSSLTNEKFAVKDTYNIFPIKKESIEFQFHPDLNPEFEFFLYENCKFEESQVHS